MEGLYEDLGQSHSFNGTQVMVLTLTEEGGEGGEERERGREDGEGPGFCPLTFTGAGHLDRADMKNIKERRSR